MPVDDGTDWRWKIAAFEKTPAPVGVDPRDCGWNRGSRLLLAEDFIKEMGLDGLYGKYLDQKAEEELDMVRGEPTNLE